MSDPKIEVLISKLIKRLDSISLSTKDHGTMAELNSLIIDLSLYTIPTNYNNGKNPYKNVRSVDPDNYVPDF